jgi:RNA polymerase sigma-70 factor (ECF subfamily)
LAGLLHLSSEPGREAAIVTDLAPRQPGDAELVTRLRAGHATAFAALMQHNNQRLFRLARSVLKDDGEAEEAVQEGYVRAFTNLDAFKGEANLGTWLGRIVLNEALGRLRRRRPTVAWNDATAALAADAALTPSLEAASPERAIARQEIRRGIEQAVDRLPAEFRTVFILRAIEQMSIEETARCLGIPAETVKTRLHRANRLLRETLHIEFGSFLDGPFPFLGEQCRRLTARVLDRLGMTPP